LENAKTAIQLMADGHVKTPMNLEFLYDDHKTDLTFEEVAAQLLEFSNMCKNQGSINWSVCKALDNDPAIHSMAIELGGHCRAGLEDRHLYSFQFYCHELAFVSSWQPQRMGIVMKKIISNYDAALSAVILVIMTTLAFVNVISRYVLHASISFTDELTTSLFVYLSMFGSSVAVKKGSHLGLNILTDLFSARARKIVFIGGYLISGVFCAIAAYFGFTMIIHQMSIGQFSAALKVPEWIYGAAIPLGMLSISYRFFEGAILAIKEGAKS